jgi:hypothetical protein
MIYLHADLTLKEKALNSLIRPGAPAGRYRPPDAVLAFEDVPKSVEFRRRPSDH